MCYSCKILWTKYINEETIWNYYSERVGFRTRFWHDISELILWICFHKGHRYEPRPTIPIQPSEQKWRKQFDLLCDNDCILHKVLKWYPNSFCGFVFTRAIDHRYELRHPNPANSSAQKWKNKLIYQPKGVGCQKTLFKTYLKVFGTLPKIGLRRFPLIIAPKP